jgi:AraC-like DNA-binding protein
LADNLGALDDPARAKLAEQALDLIGLACGNGPADPQSAPARANALMLLRSAIEVRLSDPDLTPTEAAGAAGISVRYANDLLAERSTSLQRYITRRRLERCRQALEDPLQAHRTVTDIAFSWGFSDQSHFTRRFRDAFGMSPGECRRLMQERRAVGG